MFVQCLWAGMHSRDNRSQQSCLLVRRPPSKDPLAPEHLDGRRRPSWGRLPCLFFEDGSDNFHWNTGRVGGDKVCMTNYPGSIAKFRPLPGCVHLHCVSYWVGRVHAAVHITALTRENSVNTGWYPASSMTPKCGSTISHTAGPMCALWIPTPGDVCLCVQVVDCLDVDFLTDVPVGIGRGALQVVDSVGSSMW